MRKSKWDTKKWEPVKIIYEPTDEELTAGAESPQYEELGKCLPSVRAMGDYLRDFSPENIAAMNAFLTRQALAARRAIKPGEPVTLDIDSTSHVQSGDKMEGLACNYKNEWCLDSLVTFDDLGLAYGMDLRAGNTFSSDGGARMIDGVLTALPKPADATQKHRVRADSAFFREDFIRVVIKRTWIESEAGSLFDTGCWKYYAAMARISFARKNTVTTSNIFRVKNSRPITHTGY